MEVSRLATTKSLLLLSVLAALSAPVQAAVDEKISWFSLEQSFDFASWDWKNLPDPAPMLELSQQAYQSLEQAFAQYYLPPDLSTPYTDYAFRTQQNSSLYQVVAFRLSDTQQPMRVEMFGHWQDETIAGLSNLSASSALYQYVDHTRQYDPQMEDLSVGLALSYPIDNHLALRSMYSSGYLPGMGSSKLRLGIEWQF